MSGELEGFRLTPVSFNEIPHWREDDPSSLFAGLRACGLYIRSARPYGTGSLGLRCDDLMPLVEKAEEAESQASGFARRFFETECQPFRIDRTDGRPGLVTAFYEPEVSVSSKPSDEYRHPFYRRPSDLIDIDQENRPADMDPSYRFGLLRNGTISTYPDRRAIDRGYLEGQNLEIAWAKSKVDVFFAHIQGAARLCYPDGETKRITYDAKAGHPFSAIGKLLIERGEIEPANISMQSIRSWLAQHPDQTDEVLWHNRSYIFFREADVDDPALGPIAAAKVPLIAGRSLAVDRQIHTFGFPFFVHSETLTSIDCGKPFARLMLALDTGSAIVGPARGDIFTGSGDEAGELAGAVRNDADFYILVPKDAAARYI